LFNSLLNKIRVCKIAETCPGLNIRQFYFEPNKFTLSLWRERGSFLKSIDSRIVFVCESPGPSAEVRNTNFIECCFYNSFRDYRFWEACQKYNFGDCYVTNIVKCGVRRGLRHTKLEIQNCRKFLIQEIDLIKPKILVAVGGNAFQILSTDILPYLKFPSILFRITHFSCHRNPWEFWNKEFQELLRLVEDKNV